MPTYRVTVPVHTSVTYAVEAECLAAVYGELDAGHAVPLAGSKLLAQSLQPGDWDDDETHWQIEIINRKDT